MKRRIAVAVAAAAAGLLVAPAAAHADTPESVYLSDVHDAGLPIAGADRSVMLSAGYTVCTALRSGTPRENAAEGLSSSGLSWRYSDRIAVAAQMDLCPDTAE